MSETVMSSRLFQPGTIGPMTVRNRIVMPAMTTGLVAATGEVTQAMIDYYEARAKGGAGLIITETVCVDSASGRSSNTQLFIDDDRFIPGLKKLAQAMQKHGARAAIQLQHAGNTTKKAITGQQPVSPSPLARPGGEVPRELSTAEIAVLVERFAEGAARAKRAGSTAWRSTRRTAT